MSNSKSRRKRGPKERGRVSVYLDSKHVLARVPTEEGRLALLPSQYVVRQSHLPTRDVSAQVLERNEEGKEEIK